MTQKILIIQAVGTVVHFALFTGHLVYACVLVTLIFRNDNAAIMRRELTSLIKKSWSLLPKHIRKHTPALFMECLATEIVETYKDLAGISEEQEKQCLQKWRQNSDFSRFLKINISKLSHRILIIFFQSNMQLSSFWLGL